MRGTVFWRRWIVAGMALFGAIFGLGAPPAEAGGVSYAPIIGGPGGGGYAYTCPPGTYLIGINARQGAWIDQMSAVCGRWNPQAQRMEEAAVSPAFGGTGGGPAQMRCVGRGVIRSAMGRQGDNRDRTVNYLTFFCVDPFAPNRYLDSTGTSSFGDQSVGYSAGDPSDCGQNRIAVGIHGRAGAFLDGVGLICADKLTAPPPPVAVRIPARPVVRTAAPLCKPGFVWREARAGDVVCVPPESRDRVRQENAVAASRVDPNGAWGPQSCVQGFVWREAFSGDTVCVTPEVREITRAENAAGPSRTQ